MRANMTQTMAKNIMLAIGPSLHGEFCEICLRGILYDLSSMFPHIDWSKALAKAKAEYNR